jgi:hypothetical protein
MLDKRIELVPWYELEVGWEKTPSMNAAAGSDFCTYN